jgi:hypothetical protein
MVGAAYLSIVEILGFLLTLYFSLPEVCSSLFRLPGSCLFHGNKGLPTYILGFFTNYIYIIRRKEEMEAKRLMLNELKLQ